MKKETKLTKQQTSVWQVLDEIQLDEGSDTEITVASVRRAWDDVFPTTPVPSPTAVRKALEVLTDVGVLQRFDAAGGWFFNPQFSGLDDDEDELELAGTPAQATEEKPVIEEAPAVEDKQDDFDWVVLAPVKNPKKHHEMALRVGKTAKKPYVSVRVHKDLVKGWERAVLLFSPKTGAIALRQVKEGGYVLSPTGEGGSMLRITLGRHAAAAMLDATKRDLTKYFCSHSVLDDGSIVFKQTDECTHEKA